MRRLDEHVDPQGLIASFMLALLATAGMFYVNIMAALVDGLVTGLGFTNAQAGNVSSANVYGAAVGALAAVFAVPHLRWKPTALVLLIGLIAIDFSSMAIAAGCNDAACATGPTLLTAVRALHGILGGMLVGVAYSVMGRLAQPDRAFGVLLVVQYGLGGLGLMWLPKLVPAHGAGVLFVALALLGLVVLALLAFIPPYPRAMDRGEEARLSVANAAREDPRHPLGLIVAAVGAMFLFQAGNMGLGAYVLGLGRHAGLNADFASDALGYATWIGIFGAGLCVVLGTKVGRALPLLVAMIITLFGTFAFHFSSNGSVYAIANAVTAVVWAFVVPYIFGMCAQMGRGGQLTVLAGFCSKMGLASGPFLAGRLLGHDDYGLLINVMLGILVLSAVLALPTARALDRAVK